jgi:ribosomal protein S18 acetylase RimI-like enzyme
MLIHTHQLDNQQLAALGLLCADCKRIDGNVVATYQHLLGKDRIIPCNILYYHKKQLIGFLGMFFFHENTCEIGMMVAPTYRRQGIGSQMLSEMYQLNSSFDINTLVFSTPHQLNNHWLNELGLSYQNSEYRMQWESNHAAAENPARNKSFSINLATPTDIPALHLIDAACFSQHQSDMPDRFKDILNDPSYTIFILHENGEPIGKAHICWQNDGVRLADIGILPHAQGRGFGSLLIEHCISYINAITANANIFLDVETNNQRALNLYTRLGFAINNAHDYWTIPANGLDRFSTPPLVLRGKQ